MGTASQAWYRRATPVLYALLICCSLLAALVYRLRVDGIFACPASGYGSAAYLSECSAGQYGDYDHGAFWFELEPQARRAAAEAEVLFVGSSRLQFALSGGNAAAWFSAAGVRYYLLGFSHSETVAFFGPLLAKLQPHAKVVVINVDRIFDERISPPTEQILQGHDILQKYEEKRSWQALHKGLCTALPAVCGDAVAVYRERETGVWHRTGAGRFKALEVSEGPPSNDARWAGYARLGEQFLARLPVDRSCIILTIVPTVETKRDEARAIAQKLGLDLLEPRVDGLRTFDGSHLDGGSAERWSEAFLREAGPRIRRCADPPRDSMG
ncbi:MAG TPA: hypothetical protein VFV25_00885 [Methylibium sp.]